MSAQEHAQASSAYPKPRLLIDGEWIEADDRRTEPVINPATGAELGSLPHATRDDLARALSAAWKGFLVWRGTPAAERANIMRRAAELVRQRAEAIARTMTLEQGKVLAESRGEALSCAAVLDWYAEEGSKERGRTVPRGDGLCVRVVAEPVGPVAVLTPWNFPASLATRKVAAALAAGCSCVVKPAEETPASFLLVAAALHEAGLPRGVLNVVYGRPADVSSELIASPVIRKISFTGSTRVGKLLARQAAEVAKPATLELGGHAPVIVAEDADLDLAVAASITAKARNGGQVCISPTRFFVHRRLYEAFAARLAEGLGRLRVGDGLDPDSQMGPLANPRRVEAMQRLVEDAVARGARLAVGGRRPERAGFFWSPTVLVDVPDEAAAMREEPFGPIALVTPFDDQDGAVERANSTPYALGAYLFTGSSQRAEALASSLEAGMVGVNNYNVVFTETPIGGMKESGYGRDGGPEGLSAFLVSKVVSVA